VEDVADKAVLLSLRVYGQKTTGHKTTGQKTTKNANPGQKATIVESL